MAYKSKKETKPAKPDELYTYIDQKYEDQFKEIVFELEARLSRQAA